MSERFVWHRAAQYAGPLDLGPKFRGHLTLVDFKTTANIDRIGTYLGDYKLQIVAYAAALEDSTDHSVQGF